LRLAEAQRAVERPEEMAVGVESPKRRRRLKRLLPTVAAGSAEIANTKVAENGPRQYTYKLISDLN